MRKRKLDVYGIFQNIMIALMIFMIIAIVVLWFVPHEPKYEEYNKTIEVDLFIMQCENNNYNQSQSSIIKYCTDMCLNNTCYPMTLTYYTKERINVTQMRITRIVK